MTDDLANQIRAPVGNAEPVSVNEAVARAVGLRVVASPVVPSKGRAFPRRRPHVLVIAAGVLVLATPAAARKAMAEAGIRESYGPQTTQTSVTIQIANLGVPETVAVPPGAVDLTGHG
jgi:hypothetical protein